MERVIGKFYRVDEPTVGQQRGWCRLLLSELKDLLFQLGGLTDEVNRIAKGSFRLMRTGLSDEFRRVFEREVPGKLLEIERNLKDLMNRVTLELDELTRVYKSEVSVRA